MMADNPLKSPPGISRDLQMDVPVFVNLFYAFIIDALIFS